MKRSDRFSLLGFSSDCEVESVAVEGGKEVGGFGRNVNSPHISIIHQSEVIFFFFGEGGFRARQEMKT